MRPGWLLYGKLIRRGQVLDEVVLECVAREPSAAYVINCHGGALAARRVLEALRQEGVESCSWARLLQEAQERGALDPIRREVAERLPGACTLAACRVLLDQWAGALEREVNRIRQGLRETGDWNAASRRLRRLIRTAAFGRGLFEHKRVVLAGRFNVGKSTLANALLRFERVLTHPTPGTTRDTVEALLAIQGVPFVLVDTAGLRESDDEVEREGVRRGAEELARADVAVLVFDGSVPLRQEDLDLAERARALRVVPVLNKCDLPRVVPPEALVHRLGQAPLRVSALTGAGLDQLESRILDAALSLGPRGPAPLQANEAQDVRQTPIATSREKPFRPGKGEPVVFTERQERHLRAAAEAAASRDRDRLDGSLEAIVRGP